MIAVSPLAPGLAAQIEATVTEKDLALALGSGDVAVLGTPRMIALAEAATMEALAGALEEGWTSVGTRVDMRHLSPTPTGGTLRIRAELTGVDGRALTFAVEVLDGHSLAGRGTIERFLVERETFLQRVQQRRK
ncbi:thioesterase family protein [Novosphingobium album (ex Hu et al. 2023)]|uniref:Thioesterase family protein n=1 Tax=Novosphingobium album (ex Hu et al. 2023) TaxID=2930093 RepID=A0ABT0B3Y7_9SPHN|nr:thioesterase family protein [Novosphingobium album (ex Hu et al. 2023)]MCJ2179772.1 thioesterase family protein [Novosphingobium album (ex Hu et al. 2023)]